MSGNAPNDELMMAEHSGVRQLKAIDANMESSEDSSNDEIQRYMHGRGSNKRHTVGCTDDYDLEPSLTHSPIPSTSGASNQSAAGSSGGRTRKSGLLTVMERNPPGMKIYDLFCMPLLWLFNNFVFF